MQTHSRKKTVMYFSSQQRLDDGVTLERDFLLGDIPGVLWTPVSASAPVPLILLGHSAGLPTMYPRLLSRAQHAVSAGFSAATIELPGSAVSGSGSTSSSRRALVYAVHCRPANPSQTKSSTGSCSH